MAGTGQNRRKFMGGIAAVACAGLIPVAAGAAAMAGTDAQEAAASVVIVEPVGAGFSYDILNDAVSAVFLNGDAGDSVSVLMSRRRTGPRNLQRVTADPQGGVVVMASGVYRIDLLTPVNSAARGLRSLMLPGGGSILFLAQFN